VHPQSEDQLACMSHPLPPDRPKPSHDYVKEQRAKLAPAEKARRDVALCINGGGLLPPAAMFGAAQRLSAPSERMLTLPLASGVYRGLAKMKTTPRKPKCDNVLDNFDVIGGASGGAIAATVYCYSESEPCTFFGTDDPANDPDPSKITKAAMEAEPAPYGKMLAAPYGPALCFPLRPAFCCIPLAVWTVIDYALGTPIRALGCGKWVGCGCYPCATGFGVAWIEFMYANFVGPLGIRRGSTEPPTRPEALPAPLSPPPPPLSLLPQLRPAAAYLTSLLHAGADPARPRHHGLARRRRSQGLHRHCPRLDDWGLEESLGRRHCQRAGPGGQAVQHVPRCRGEGRGQEPHAGPPAQDRPRVPVG